MIEFLLNNIIMSFNFSISRKDLSEIYYEIIYSLTILLIYHLLSYEIDKDIEFMNIKFLKLILYVVIGIIFFHLIIKKIFNLSEPMENKIKIKKPKKIKKSKKTEDKSE